MIGEHSSAHAPPNPDDEHPIQADAGAAAADGQALRESLDAIQSHLREFGRDPLLIDRAQGLYVFDVDGNRLLDSMSGYWLACLGHGDPAIVETLAKASQRLSFWHLFETAHTPVLRYVEDLQARLPEPLRGKVIFANTGSAAMENALRVACARDVALGRDSVIAHLDGSYHGSTFLAQQASPWNDWPASLRLEPGRVRAFPSPLDDAAASACLEALEQACRGPRPPTMLLTEPIQGVGGMVVPSSGFFDALAEVCQRHAVTWVSDEISTGFGATGRLFAFEWHNALPDIVVLGKKMAAGYFPMAGALVSRALSEQVLQGRPFHHSYSTAGHPVGCEVARAVLRRVSDPALLRHVQARGLQLRQGLVALSKRHALLEQVRGEGLMVAAQLPNSKIAARAAQRMRAYGVYQMPEGKFLTFCPPFVIGSEEVEVLLTALDRALVDCA